MKYGIWILLLLTGCDPGDSPDVRHYETDPYLFHEQKYSSEDRSEWASTNYPQNCDWIGFGRVVDGDTIVAYDDDGQVRVRMIGIDTPESKKEGTPIQAFSLDATRELQSLIGDPLQVCLIQDQVGDQYDIYDRRLSYVFTESGLDLNAEMLKKGWAKAYLRFPFERRDEFAELEATAKAAGVGRWE